MNPYGEGTQPEPEVPAAPPVPPPGPQQPAWGTPTSPGTGYETPAAPPPVHGPGQTYGPPQGGYSPYVAQNGYGGPAMPGGYGGWMTSSRDNGKGTGSLIMGILSIVLCFSSLIGVGLGVGAIIMGVQGRKAADGGTADNRGVSTGGFILGIVGAALSLLASLGYLSSLLTG